jgi:DNA-3-methyladenine glycosylase I
MDRRVCNALAGYFTLRYWPVAHCAAARVTRNRKGGLMIKRCPWSESNAQEIAYHDSEWGVPLHDDRRLFELLILEGAQAGLSWDTILKKRDNYRAAFDHFDAEKIARYNSRKISALMNNTGIVRNRLKIAATVINAQKFIEVQAQCGSFDAYIWQFIGGKPLQNKWRSSTQVPASTAQSDAMSKALKQRGFKFVGTTICYAYMQATGMVNDHLVSCLRYKAVQ